MPPMAYLQVRPVCTSPYFALTGLFKLSKRLIGKHSPSIQPSTVYFTGINQNERKNYVFDFDFREESFWLTKLRFFPKKFFAAS